MRKTFSHLLVLAVVLAVSVTTGRNASAQSEIDVYGGLWLPFLPDYNAGSIVTNGGGSVLVPNVFNDDQIDAGGQIGLRGLHRFLPTRTMVEFDVNIAGVDSMGSSSTIADPNAASTVWLSNLQGNAFLATPDGTSATFSLDSDVLHYSEFIGLRDRFDLRDWGLGLFDIGCGFSHLGFEQDFVLDVAPINGGLSGQYVEELDTHYVGGDIRSTFNQCWNGRWVRFDLNLGIYDMDGQYDGTSYFRNAVGTVFDSARVIDELKKTAFTVDVGLRVDTNVRGVLVRPGIHLKYLSDMVSINHPQTNVAAIPATLSTKEAYILGLNVEIML